MAGRRALARPLHLIPGHLCSLEIMSLPPEGKVPVRLSLGSVCRICRYQEASLLLISSRGKANLIQTWQMGSQTWLPPKQALPHQLLVVLWTPRPEGASDPSSLPTWAGLTQHGDLGVPSLSVHPRDREPPQDLMASPFQEKPTAPCNAQGSTYSALPGQRRAFP